MHFDERSTVHKTLRQITSRLQSLGIPHTVAGGMAMFAHGYRRFTEDVGILVSRESMSRIHEQLEGLGYVVPFAGSRNLRAADTGVCIEFLIEGAFPGDGKPKSVSFPNPADASIEIDGVRYLGLEKLIELKLASGMTGGVARLKDFADVGELIKSLNLAREYAGKLNPYVQPKYLEFWDGLKQLPPEK